MLMLVDVEDPLEKFQVQLLEATVLFKSIHITAFALAFPLPLSLHLPLPFIGMFARRFSNIGLIVLEQCLHLKPECVMEHNVYIDDIYSQHTYYFTTYHLLFNYL